MLRIRRPRSPVHTLRRTAAALLAIAALILAMRPAPEPESGAVPATVPVVVAAMDLPPGTVLTEANLALARLPPDVAPTGTAAAPRDLDGHALAGAVRAGEPITDVRLAASVLTAALPDGHVAAPVRLADLAVAVQVHAGDRVDVLATTGNADVAELVASAALVLLAPSDPDAATAGALWLATTPPVAARLAAASSTSTLTVSLVAA